jgi:hypothetical protein
MATQPDNVWFNDRPWRNYRVRPLTSGEIFQGVPPTAPPGRTMVAAVRRLTDYRLMVVYTAGCEGLDYARLSEAAACGIFESALAAMPADIRTQILSDIAMEAP